MRRKRKRRKLTGAKLPALPVSVRVEPSQMRAGQKDLVIREGRRMWRVLLVPAQGKRWFALERN